MELIDIALYALALIPLWIAVLTFALRCSVWHRWSSWTAEIVECPGEVIEVFELHQRFCKRCGVRDEKEVDLTCVSS
ncbi:hypothetical protein [Streptomyces formicae]|uniref:Mobile element protein n=1 Tax=Streptomyces formicae TaxID=1616117 RepID=A0ABY3WI91_9ACTN|nr:hypothetical protein [Streptomyces formicae]UNM12298.1 hypothetical protein J4032_12835 [Streptomyces formicae]